MHPSFLATDDVRALLRLAGECREVAAAGESPLGHAMSTLAVLTRSQVGIWVKAVMGANAVPIASATVEQGWGCDSDRSRVWSYVLGEMNRSHPLMGSLPGEPGQLVTVIRRDLMSDDQWGKSELCNDVYAGAGIADSMVSSTKEADGGVRALIFKRALSAQAFTERDREIVHIFRTECPWAENDVAPDTKLSPRERQTLTLLLTGLSEKEVAARLGLSPHTTHDYVKSVYRKVGARSRAELMARAAR